MFFEFALDPSAVSTWESARYFLDAFGPWKGRFLAQYPKHWGQLLLAGVTCGDVEKKRITVRLEQAKKNHVFLRRTDAPYDGGWQWLRNAQGEHVRQAFHAIIARETAGDDSILEAAHLDENDVRWRVDGGQLLSRDPAAFAQALDLLFRASSKLVLVDPYFRADQPSKTSPLTAFCARILRRIPEVQIHFSAESRAYSMAMWDAARALPWAVPQGMRVTLFCWKERSGGPRLHNRYILTDVGGVQFGDSIEVGLSGQHDRVSILEETTRNRLWEDFMGPTPAFDLDGPPKTFEGRRGT